MRGDTASAHLIRLAPADVFWAVGSLCNVHRIPFDAGLLTRELPPPHTSATLVDGLRLVGFEVALAARPAAAIASLQLPALVLLRAPEPDATTTPDSAAVAEEGRPALVVRCEGDRVLYFSAGTNTPIVATLAEFARLYAGFAVIVTRSPATAPADADDALVRGAPFGFRWFVPELLRHRSVWREVLAASLVLQLLALALPLTSQIIIDKVIVNRTTSTLMVIASALGVLIVFSSALTWIRQYLVTHTGNRVDAVLGASVFRHLLRVPIRFFERRPTGVLVARLNGIEVIREFLSGAAVTMALDVPFLLVFLAVMLVYNVPLTAATLVIVLAITGLSFAVAPVLQQRLNAQFLAGARNQALVTEYVAAIETVKSLQLEPQLTQRYEAQLSTYLETSFATRQLANTYGTLANGLEQLLSGAILCFGAWIVMTSNDFTIGMLVAFQMFAARVAQPLLRLAGLWQQFQQATIAVRRLADIMDVPGEPSAVLPAREGGGPGRIELKGVGFRYDESRPWLYRGLDLAIEPGECVVVTGPSGCGKSTLFKLVQGFAFPVEGQVLLDGRDTRHLAANQLRAHFGVVPQETMLFSGTILDNLLLANPLVTFEQIVQACKLAEIHAVIEALPDGYRTEVGERGVGLSGGQKQRIALARALLRRPKVLLLDEPVSQLDAESAGRIAAAVSRLKGKLTIVLVSHQLPTLLKYDRIVEVPTAV